MSRLRVKLDGSLPWDPAIALEVMEKLFPKIEFLSFEEAREFAIKLNLKSLQEWYRYWKENKRPGNIPSGPNAIYKDKGWNGWGDFLGTGNVSNSNREFISFKDAREFSIRLGLSGQREWLEYSSSGSRPDYIPACPYITYKDEFQGYGDWLGTGNVRNMEFWAFEELRQYARALKLKGHKQWQIHCKSRDRVDGLTPCPDKIYQDKGWSGWKDFLGGFYLSFEEAKEFIQKLNLDGTTEWLEYCKSGNKPENIPFTPDIVYADKGWLGIRDFLGTSFLSFEKTRDFVQKLNLKSQQKWNIYSSSNERPRNIPSTPRKVYKDEGWTSWGDFLGSDNFRGDIFLSFEEARKIARTLKLKSKKEWLEYCKSGKRPKNIPSNPSITYKDEFLGICDWLGFESGRRVFLTFEETTEFVRKLKLRGVKEWRKYLKSGKKPEDIPAGPDSTYKDKGWVSWPDFLGTNK